MSGRGGFYEEMFPEAYEEAPMDWTDDEVELVAKVFMSWLPNNNRPVSDEDRRAACGLLDNAFAPILARRLSGPSAEAE